MKTFKKRSGPTGALIAAIAGIFAVGCGNASMSAESTASAESNLIKPDGIKLWPGQNIDVCFVSGPATATEQATWRSNIQKWLPGSISAVTNLTYTGFGTCGTNSNNKLTIKYDPTQGNSWAYVGWTGYDDITGITFGLDSSAQGVVLHETMHTLGFQHEYIRNDNPGDTRCPTVTAEQKITGTTYGTPYDSYSILNDTYCGTWNNLSGWDIVGLRTAYGNKPNLHGFMIKSDKNSALAVNAWNGAREGAQLRLHDACTATNTDCTWTYIDGMLRSDTDPSLAINALNGAREGASLILTKTCTKDNPDCTWTYSKGEFISDRNPALAINAVNGAVHGAYLETTAACTKDNPDCTWTLPNMMIPSMHDTTLNWNAYLGAKHGAEIKLVDICDQSNADCTFTFKKGMIVSDRDASLGVNAWDGATNTAALKLHNQCTSSNPDCTFTWKKGQLLSDRNSTLVASTIAGATFGASVQLSSGCTENNPDCLFWSWIGK